MFWNKRDRQQAFEKLSELEENGRMQAQTLAEQAGKLTSLQDSLAALVKGQEELQKAFRKQMFSYEDFLDEVQEQTGRQTTEARLLEEAAVREKALLDVICVFTEQRKLLQEQILSKLQETDAEKYTAWKKQFEIMNNEGRKSMSLAGIQETGEPGEAFQYELHEVLDVLYTHEEEKDKTVAKIYSPGLIYCGKTIRKAKAAVYRRMDDEGQDNRD